MKKLLLTLLFGASCMLPASAAKYMTLVFADGSEQSLLLSNYPTVSFNSTQLIVQFYDVVAGQTELNFNKQELKKYFFSDEATDVESVVDTQTGMSVQGNRIVVRGAKGAVGVFRTDGTQVQTVVKADGDTVVIELDNLANGTYIVRAGKNVVKIAKN
ncbi:hypothetical protein [Leyella stercorea]|uniref:hypothetical protein n=1 Tax=Leyella stercorea TaxID=363265 RepID=UPI00242DD6F0|nr:hypothetical protein [Leyella stercorea]